MADTPNIPARPVLQGEAERNVSLREFEQRIQSLAQQINDQIRAARELADAKAQALSQALELQAEEYKRRLSELNHAHETAMENWRMSLPREMFESHLSEWQKWRETVSGQLVTLTHVTPSIGAVEQRLVAAENTLMATNGSNERLNAVAEKVEDLKTRLNALQSERMGIKGGWGYAVGVVGFLLVLFSLAMMVWKFGQP